jgi:HEAT repeat protein
VKRLILFLFAFVLAAIGTVRAGTWQTGPVQLSVDPETMQKEFLSRVDEVIGILSETNGAACMKVWLASREIKASANAAAAMGPGNPPPMAQLARELLGGERYDGLERACLAVSDGGEGELRRAARHVLSQALGSHAREEAWARQMNGILAALMEDEPVQGSPEEVFSLAESLAWLGNDAGEPILQSVLEEDGLPPGMTRQALEALSFLKKPFPPDVLEKLLSSGEAVVAYTAFDVSSSDRTAPLLQRAAKTQLARLRGLHGKRGSLPWNESVLLHKVCSVLGDGVRSGALSDAEKAEAKAVARYFIETGDGSLPERTVFLFADLCGEEDVGLLETLLESPSPILRAQAARGLGGCPPAVLERHRERLLVLQEDSDSMVRLFASNALQRLANAEKAEPAAGE